MTEVSPELIKGNSNMDQCTLLFSEEVYGHSMCGCPSLNSHLGHGCIQSLILVATMSTYCHKKPEVIIIHLNLF